MQKILVVDDVQTDRELVGAVVSQSGNQPVYAVDGEQAVEKVKSEKPALVFLDVVMPKHDGFKACRQLKADPETAKVPIVLVTSKGTESDKFWGKKQGADGHLVKPFTPDALLSVIKTFVR
jgi:twitching motility two-component system response regulator PilH